MIKTRNELLGAIIGIFVGSLLISNILTSKQFTVGELSLTCGVIVFPIVYIVNDMLAEIYGYEIAKKIIMLGFVVQLIAVLSYALAIALPAPSYALESADAFATVLGSSGRILLASFIAYLVGSLLNAKVMVKLKRKYEDRLMYRCVTSTLIGEGVDSTIFLTIAFLGILPFEEILILILCEALFKICFEICVYPVTRTVIHKARALEG